MGILLKSQYVVKHATSESRLALIHSPTVPYIGPYLSTTLGRLISGDSRNNRGPDLTLLIEPSEQKGGIEFLPYDRLKSSIKAKITKPDPYPELNFPTKSDYDKLFFIRHFCLDNRTRIFVEISKSQKRNVDPNIYTLYSIKWNLSPTLGYKYNKKITSRLKKIGFIKITPYDYIKQQPTVPD